MATFVVLMNLTDQGIQNIKEAPERIAEATQAIEAAGGKITAVYLTMGSYDYVSVVEGINDEVALANLMALSMQGNVRTMTMRAFKADELPAILNKLP
jgi:uncharacterized protein with GYD domain